MYIELNITPDIKQSSFINYAIKIELMQYFRRNLSDEIEASWDDYFKQLNINITCDKLLKILLQNLQFNTIDSHYVVTIDPTYKIPNIDYNLSKLVSLFNYGNLSKKGTNLINQAADYLKKNLNNLLMKKYFGAFI